MVKKLKVLLLIYKLEVAGAERVVVTLAKGLDRKRFNPIVCSFKTGPLAEEIKASGIPTCVLGKKSGLDLGFIYRLGRLIKTEKADIIHAHTFAPNFWGRILGGLAGVPVIITTEHTVCGSNKRTWQKLSDRLLAGLSSRIVAVSEEVRQSHINAEKIDTGKIVTIYNGIDGFESKATLPVWEKAGKKEKLGFDPHAPLIINVGRLEPPKGHKYLLQAIKLVAEIQPAVQFLIVGDGPLREELQCLANQLGISRQVLFAGFRSDVSELLQLADMAVLPSVREGFSITLLEAMAEGKPLVATDVGGNREAILDGVTGIIVPPRNPVAISTAILKLLQDETLASKMGLAGKNRFLQKFSAGIMLNKVENLYMELIWN